MRHLGTLIAAAVIAPLAWILLAFGQDRSAAAFAAGQRAGVLHADDFVRPLPFLAAAGLLVGLVVTLRFSPAGALFAGVGYVSSYTVLLVAPNRTMDLVGRDVSVAGHHGDLGAPVRSGTTLVLGVMLLVAAVGVSRWRRRPEPAVEVDWWTDFEPTAHRPLGADGLGLTPPREARSLRAVSNQ